MNLYSLNYIKIMCNEDFSKILSKDDVFVLSSYLDSHSDEQDILDVVNGSVKDSIDKDFLKSKTYEKLFYHYYSKNISWAGSGNLSDFSDRLINDLKESWFYIILDIIETKLK